MKPSPKRDGELCGKASSPWISWSWSWRATAAFHRGDWEVATRHAARAEALAPLPVPSTAREWALHLEFSAYAGRRDEALYDDGGSPVRATAYWENRAAGGRGRCLAGAMQSHIAVGDLDAAAELYPLVRWCAERTGNLILDATRLPPPSNAVAGMAAAAGSNWDVC